VVRGKGHVGGIDVKWGGEESEKGGKRQYAKGAGKGGTSTRYCSLRVEV